ncbi:MAG: TRAP transporter fused permease subunit [Clostridia bacterium]|nr:TRAP transporter fused permease subunit [Clostridia bacterium]
MNFFKKKTASVPDSQEPMDLDSVMKKYDRESNTRIWEGVPKIIVNSVLALFSVFCLYVTLFANLQDEVRLTTFVAFIVLMGFLVFPIKKGTQKVNHLPWYDIILMVLGTGSFLYYTFSVNAIIDRGLNLTTLDIIVAITGILILCELCRRCVGFPILIVAGALCLYAIFRNFNGNFNMLRLNFTNLVYNLFYMKNGILGTPINVCSKFIVAFIIFGAFLERTGIADFFIQISNAIVGRFSGGPAKVAVVASALEGMVSGSSVANTVGSGAVTIPLMKRTGYKPEFAAAAEAAASTGGQIMPPIMGAAAFLMAENIGLPYGNIVLVAILPALLYFLGVFLTVHFEAKRENLRGLTKDELPKIKPLLKKLYLLLPLIVLIYLVGSGSNSIQYAAAIAIVVAILVSLFNKENRITPKRFFEALAAGGQGMITVAVACGVAGIVAGAITTSGLASDLITGIVAISGNQKIIALFLTMLCCIVLGMGVPTTANYCIMAATCAPILLEMGIPAIAAHFFVFYFGIVADLTPPVALAAYAGAAIAGANPMKTAFTATKLAIGAFIVPYVFALNPAMLFVDSTPLQVVVIAITAIVGICAVAASLEGYFLRHMFWYERIVCLIGGLLLIIPGTLTDVIGVAIVALVVVVQIITRKMELKPKKA